MQKRNLKFALLLRDGRPVRSLEELKAHYDIEKIISYYENGQLERWLEQNNYMNQLEDVRELKIELKNRLKSTLETILLNDEAKEKDLIDVVKKDLQEKNENAMKSKSLSIDEIYSEKINIKNNPQNQSLYDKKEDLLEINNVMEDKDKVEKLKIKEEANENGEKKNAKDHMEELNINKLENKKVNINELSKEKEVLNEGDKKRVIVSELNKESIIVAEPRKESGSINNKKQSTIMINKGSSLHKESNKSSSTLGEIQDLFNRRKTEVETIDSNDNQYSKEDIMINREKMLSSRKGIVTGLKKKSSLENHEKEEKNPKKDNPLSYGINSIKKENVRSSVDISVLDKNDKKQNKTNNTIDNNVNNFVNNSINNSVSTDIDSDIKLNSKSKNKVDIDVLEDEEFKKMSEIITDPKSLQMLKEFYLKNKHNIKAKHPEQTMNNVTNNSINNNINQSSIKESINNTNIENVVLNESLKDNGNIHLDNKSVNNDKSDIIRKNVDFATFTIFSQEEYESILGRRESCETHLQIHVAFNGLMINAINANIQYVGINNQIVLLNEDIYFDAIKNKISFLNLRISANNPITFMCDSIEGCSIDRSKIKKGIQDLITKYPGMIVKEQICKYVSKDEIEDLGKERSLEDFIDELFIQSNNQIEILATAKYEGVEIYTNVFMGMVDKAFLKDHTDKIHDISNIFENMESIDVFRKDPDIGIKFIALLKKSDLKIIEGKKNKQYKNSVEALEDILTGKNIEEFLQYVMIMPIKIFKSQGDLSRKDQIKLIELMNLDTGIPYISRHFMGTADQLKGEVYGFVDKLSSSQEMDGIIFEGVTLEHIDDEETTINQNSKEAIYKFRNDFLKTRITDIKFLLDKDKKMNAYIGIEEITIKDETIKLIKLRDSDLFKKLGLNVGDYITVSLNKNNFIINKQLNSSNSKSIHIPLVCPYCGQSLSFREVGTFGMCENNQCEGSIVSGIYTQLLDLKLYNVNFEMIANAHSKGFINNIADLIELPPQNLAKILNLNLDKTKEIQRMIKGKSNINI